MAAIGSFSSEDVRARQNSKATNIPKAPYSRAPSRGTDGRTFTGAQLFLDLNYLSKYPARAASWGALETVDGSGDPAGD